MKSYLEKIVDDVVEMICGLVDPPLEHHIFPQWSCIGVACFIAPFIRLVTAYDCRVAIGSYDGDTHAWLVCQSTFQENFYVDATIMQFDKDASRVVLIDEGSLYIIGYCLNLDEENSLRNHSEFDGMRIATKYGRDWLDKGLKLAQEKSNV